jgi:hypothetical protein
VLVCDETKKAYPIVDEVPILIEPEALSCDRSVQNIDITNEKYAESYQESEHYNTVAKKSIGNVESSSAYTDLRSALAATKQDCKSFPYPIDVWIGQKAVASSLARVDAYSHLKPLDGACILEIGGSGVQAIKMLLAGARVA